MDPELKMYFPIKRMGIFQPAMLVYQRVTSIIILWDSLKGECECLGGPSPHPPLVVFPYDFLISHPLRKAWKIFAKQQIWGFPKIGVKPPKWMVKRMENPIF